MADKRCDWTTETLFEHFTALREADHRAREAERLATDNRLMGMNEWRQTVEGVIKNTPTRAEVVGMQNELRTETAGLRRESRAFLFGAISLTIAVVTLLINVLK